jgi:hypothetical protein
MNDLTISKLVAMNVLNDIQSMVHELPLEELDALIDDLNALYTKYNEHVPIEDDKP